MKKLIVGSKYFIKDKIDNDIYEVLIINCDDIELTYRNLDTNKEQYREIDDIEIISIIDVLDEKRLNNKNVFSIQTDLVKAIISRSEIIEYSKNKFENLNKDDKTVLISITDPNNDLLSNDILNQFKDSLCVQFWDIEEQIGNYEPINDEITLKILNFIEKHKTNNFIIHCEAGISRSAAIGLAIFYICQFKHIDKDVFLNNDNPLKEHIRYYPNMFVFNRIVEKMTKN